MTFVADTTTTVNGHSVGIYFGFVLGVVNKIYVVVEVRWRIGNGCGWGRSWSRGLLSCMKVLKPHFYQLNIFI